MPGLRLMTASRFKRYARAVSGSAVILLLACASCVPATAQEHRDHRDNRRNNNFYQGARDGGRNGDYGYGSDRRDQRNYNARGDNRAYNNRDYNQGGIGPGKGAAIGAIGGALLGTIFGGGLKGAVVGGAAGAGIGAIAGQAHQNSQRRQYYAGRPY